MGNLLGGSDIIIIFGETAWCSVVSLSSVNAVTAL